jgi:hypothetical protein
MYLNSGEQKEDFSAISRVHVFPSMHDYPLTISSPFVFDVTFSYQNYTSIARAGPGAYYQVTTSLYTLSLSVFDRVVQLPTLLVNDHPRWLVFVNFY